MINIDSRVDIPSFLEDERVSKLNSALSINYPT